jgi:hypothetical protein
MEILQFIFSSFWHWLGTLILLAVVSGGIGGMFRRGDD